QNCYSAHRASWIGSQCRISWRRDPSAPCLLPRNVLSPILLSWSERLAPAEKGSIDADVLQPVEIAGERIFSEHDHVRDLADLERSVPILVPGHPMAALCRHPQRLFSGQPTVSHFSLTTIVPSRDPLPRRPQHRIGHSVG